MANLAYGNLTKHFAKVQTALDTFIAFAAADAVSPIAGSFKLEPFKTYEKSKEAAGTATLQTEIAGRRGGKWSLQSYIKPNSAGTAPDVGEIIRAAMGVETINAGVSAVYTLSDTALLALQLLEQAGTNFQQVASGAWVESFSIEADNAGPPMMSFSGGYARHGQAAECVTSTVLAGSATSIVLDDEDEGCIIPPCILAVGQYDNATLGYIASAYTWATNTITIAAIAANYCKVYDASAVTYYDLSEASAGDFVQWQLLPNNTQDTDYVLFGFEEFPAKFQVDMSATVQTYIGDATTWQYWNGASWSTLTLTSDGTDAIAGDGKRSFGQDGTITITAPSNAASSTIDSQAAYWIRCNAGTAANISQVGITATKLPNLLPIGEAITAMSPTPSIAGTIMGPGAHTLSLFGESLGFVSFKLNVQTGIKGLDKEATTDRVNRLSRGERVIEGEISFVFLDNTTGNARVLGRAWNGVTGAISLALGGTVTVALPAVRLEVSTWDVPEQEEIGCIAKFIARQSAAAADELSITFA